MHPDLIAALKAGWPIRHLVTVTLPGYTIRWSTTGFVKWGADTWKRRDATYGVLDTISEITDGIDDDASPVQISIIPPDLTSMAALASSDAQGGWVTIHLACTNPTTGLVVADPYQLHLGELDQPRLRPGKTRRLDYDIISGEARGLQPNGEQRQTDAFHQLIWPGELGNQYATDGTKRTYWRADEPKNAIGLLTGRGSDDQNDKALEFTYKPDAAMAFPFGRCAYGGDIRYRVGYGPTNRWQSIFATAGASGPVKSLISVSFDDEVTNFDGNNRATNGSHAGEMWFKFLPGAQPAPALTSPTGTNAHSSAAPGWTTAHKLSGRPSYVWTGKENSKESEYQGGIPKPVLTLEGLFGHDPRAVGSLINTPTTWPWIQEGCIGAMNWAIGRWEGSNGGTPAKYGVPYESVSVGGVAAPLETIDVSAFVAAANIADANGWTMAGVAYSDENKIEVLEDMLRASGAVRSRRRGMISCVSFGAIATTVLTATQDDTAGPPDITLAASRLDRKNTGIPSFLSENNRWEITPLAPVSNPAWVTEDGGRQTEGFDYRFVSAAGQAAQLCYLEMAHAREPVDASARFKPWMMQLEPGDAFDWDEPEYLLNGTKVRVLKRTWDPMACVAKIDFRQETDAKYAEAFSQTGTAPPISAPETPVYGSPINDIIYGPPGSGGGTYTGDYDATKGADWDTGVYNRPINIAALTGTEAIQNSILQTSLVSGAVKPAESTAVTGQTAWATLPTTTNRLNYLNNSGELLDLAYVVIKPLSALTGRTANYVSYVGGATVESLQPGEVGANVTEGRTAAAITGQGTLATRSLVTGSLMDMGDRANMVPDPTMTDAASFVLPSGGGLETTPDAVASRGRLFLPYSAVETFGATKAFPAEAGKGYFASSYLTSVDALSMSLYAEWFSDAAGTVGNGYAVIGARSTAGRVNKIVVAPAGTRSARLTAYRPAGGASWASWSENAKIAAAFCISPIALEHRITRQRRRGLEGPFRVRPTVERQRPEDDPIPGEMWRDVPSLGLAVSSEQRVKSLATGFLRSVHKEAHTGRTAVNYETDDKRGTITIHRLLAMAAGKPLPPQAPAYSPDEDRALVAAATVDEALAKLPGRSRHSVLHRARIIGTRFARAQPRRPVVPRLKAEYGTIVDFAKRYPPDLRGDLIGHVTVLVGEGFRGELATAFKQAKVHLGRLSNPFRDISFDAPIRGTEDLKLSDVIASDHPHF